MIERLRRGVFLGLIGGLAAWHLSLVGMVETFANRRLVGESVTLGYVLLLGIALLIGYLAVRRARSGWDSLIDAGVAGALVGLMTGLLAVLITEVNVRQVFTAATAGLVGILTLHRGVSATGIAAIIGVSALAGVGGGLLARASPAIRNAFGSAALVTLLTGLLRDVIGPLMPQGLVDALYSPAGGLKLQSALVVFLLTLALFGAREANIRYARSARRTVSGARVLRAQSLAFKVLGLAFLISFPLWGKIFLSNTADFVGLYIMMGLGLNLVVGFTGLLDLGYVAFFAIGAYTIAIMTSPELLGVTDSFWVALPFAILAAVLAGVILGLPVLRMRGDYLAIATLGFGEIVRLLVLSDWLRPHLGGARGVTQIARPDIGSIAVDRPQAFYYLILAGCLLAWFLSTRLKTSRIGRAWMAIREDEDVAQAMGINRVLAKLLAFALGASMGGLSGALFASLVGSVVPASFSVLVSINVLALIIIGGMGSLPGVVVGALALVGLPELLREFQEYRLLVYGAVLIAMMLFRPAGLWPEETRVRELEEAAEVGGALVPAGAVSAADVAGAED